MYTRDIKKGQDYSELKKTIVVLIADFKVKGLETLEYHSQWKIIEKENKKLILTDKFEIHIIEIPKVADNQKEEELIDWLTFLENPNSERVIEKMENNEELKQAVDKLNTISEDEYMQRIADLREKAILDEIWKKNNAKRRMEEGMKKALQEGEEKGIKQGIEKGIKQGIKQGIEQEKRQIAKKMLLNNMKIADIVNLTGLTEQEIMKL